MPTTDELVETVTALVEDAVTAPSMHNAQPWRFIHRAGTRSLALYGDPSRTLPAGDPEGRGLHLGCGAALFNLRVSAAHHGWDAAVELLPDPATPGIWPMWCSRSPTRWSRRPRVRSSPTSTPRCRGGTPAASPSPTSGSRARSSTGCAAPPFWRGAG